MRAQISVTADVNMLALQRILQENGLWLVWINTKRIERAVRVPRGVSVDQLIASQAETNKDQSNSQT